MAAAIDAFTRGDYLSAARHLTPDTWQYWASLGLIGHTSEVSQALEQFADADAVFYSAAASWIAGDTARALRLLERCDGDHAQRLGGLISRAPITVVAQLPWNRSGSWDILTNLNDPAFQLLNISFHRDDIQNAPYGDIRTLVPPGVQPDFFVAEMLEWHLVPPNVRALGCPVLGHSSDFDLHIQAVAPWLEVFDELVVLDSLEWRLMSGLVSVPVSVFPKVFGVPRRLPMLSDFERDIDVFLSGTVTHPYHVDKDPVVLDVLSLPDIRLRMVNGFDTVARYYRNLSRSKLCCTYIRHPGALPTRGLEALGMGCAVAVQEESALRLFLGDSAGVVPYGDTSGGLPAVIETVLSNWDTYGAQASVGAARVRHEFALDRLASQYFRFLTVLAARPRLPRSGPVPEGLVQKRAIVQKGWLPSYRFGGPLLTNWAEHSNTRLERQLHSTESPRLLNDLARERLLAYYHDLCKGSSQRLAHVVAPLERAIERFPQALVPRLNLARVCVHFGQPGQVRQGIALLDDTLRRSDEHWQISPLDDVLPWDFCPSFFNYRRYFDTVTRSIANASAARGDMIATIRASLSYYRAMYAEEIPGDRTRLEWAAESARLDPDFADYVLYWTRLLLTRAGRDDVADAAVELQRLSQQSARLLEILELARHLPPDLQGPWYGELERRTARLWRAMELRENPLEPILRSSREPLRSISAPASPRVAAQVP
jgi:hypothetical protein